MNRKIDRMNMRKWLLLVLVMLISLTPPFIPGCFCDDLFEEGEPQEREEGEDEAAQDMTEPMENTWTEPDTGNEVTTTSVRYVGRDYHSYYCENLGRDVVTYYKSYKYPGLSKHRQYYIPVEEYGDGDITAEEVGFDEFRIVEVYDKEKGEWVETTGIAAPGMR